MTSTTASAPTDESILLITVGSTLFPQLTDLALSRPFLDRLTDISRRSGNNIRLIVQYGRADLTFPPGVTWVKRDLASGSGELLYPAASDGGDSASIRGEGGGKLIVEFIRYTNDFEGLVKRSEWVISHAGSGSILTALRTPRPLLVVPNTSLMDNHQFELADALSGEGYLLVSTVEDLLRSLPRLLDEKLELREFPDVDHSSFRSILDETAGFAP